MNSIYQILYDKGLISEPQHTFLEGIRTNKIISLYYELRLALYLGILLLSGGLGFLIYENIGSAGHVLCMIAIAGAIWGCFWFISKYAQPFSRQEVAMPHPYFDYFVLLAAVLTISLLTYILVYFELAGTLIHSTSLITALFMFFLAYRYDNKLVLSMAIVALAASVGINLSPVTNPELLFFKEQSLYWSGILLGILYCTTGYLSGKKEIKPHFGFTYLNFGTILYFISLLSALFNSQNALFYAFMLLLSAIVTIVLSWPRKEFLFFLYGTVTFYIAATYIAWKLAEFIDAEILLIYYFPFSLTALIVIIVVNKKHFSNDRSTDIL